MKTITAKDPKTEPTITTKLPTMQDIEKQQDPTVENIAAQLEKIGYKVEKCKGFVKCYYTKKRPIQGSMIVGLQMWFKCRFAITNSQQEYFYISKAY